LEASVERIGELEWANYAATRTIAQATPDLEVVLSDNVILTSSRTFPSQDTNHACLLQGTAQSADHLIAKIASFFQAKCLPATVYLSPACTPDDLSCRLLEKGFSKQEGEESWMVLDGLSDFKLPSLYPCIRVKTISKSETSVFANVFIAAFNMPVNIAAVMAQLLRPSVGLPSVRHYLALHKEQPVGTCSLLCYESFGVLGSVGVLSQHRGSGAATTLAVRAATDARELGVETLMLQTSANTRLERLLRISGFKRAFTRTCYVLSDESTGGD
jgi:hypothetical protein